MTYGPLNGVMTDFAYDCRNRLVQVGDTTYTYDAENNRIGMETPKKQVRYIVDSQQELTRILQANETDKKTNEQKVTYYIYGRGLIAQEQITIENGATTESGGIFGRTKYKTGIYRIYHFDHLGSTTAVTNEDGNVVNSYDYSPYGQIIAGKEDVYLFLYNGQYGVTTDGNGLYHMRARYYNVSIMRFINQDVVHGNLSDSQSLNRFAYVEGNPINFLDPFGLCKWEGEETTQKWHEVLGDISYVVSLVSICFPQIEMITTAVGDLVSTIDIVVHLVELFHYSPSDRNFWVHVNAIMFDSITMIDESPITQVIFFLYDKFAEEKGNPSLSEQIVNDFDMNICDAIDLFYIIKDPIKRKELISINKDD